MPEIQKVLFVINKGAGSKKTNWQEQIKEQFNDLQHQAILFDLPPENAVAKIREELENTKATKVVSVGGDGTFALVGKAVMHTGVPVGLISSGSANGMAAELNIPSDLKEAIEVILNGKEKTIDAVEFEGEPAFHLADIGLNALIIKYFDESRFRGMITYARMLLKALFKHSLIHVNIETPDLQKRFKAYAVVFANAKKYGTGAVINPDGRLNDHRFELVIIQKIALREIFKLFFKHKGFDPKAVEVISTESATVTSRHRMHYQRDGEYLGKTKKIQSSVIEDAMVVMVPANFQDL